MVVAGGSAPSPRGVDAIPAGAAVITADSGADHALALELPVELAVGDFDSATPEALDALAARGARIERHPPAKDATDLELALQAALTLEPGRILVVGGIEGRLDHLLGELHVLGSDALAGVELDAVLGDALVHVIRGERALSGAPGELISPSHSTARRRGSIEGLVYPLHGETLVPGSSRGISNEFSETERESPSRPAYCSQCDPR